MGDVVPVKVKWLKEKYDVNIMLDEPVEVFKAQLFDLTGVPPDKQKISSGAKQIKDDTDLKSLGLKPNQLLLLIGTAEVLAAPTEKIQFVEDLAPTEMQGLIAAGVPMGLQNLENTCYMNASLQVLNNVPDLVTSLKNVPGNFQVNTNLDPRKILTIASRDVFRELATAHEPVQPLRFLFALRTAFPQFAETGEQGRAMQQDGVNVSNLMRRVQDAEECLTQLISTLADNVQEGGQSVVRKLFGIETQVTVKCSEAPDEPPITEREQLMKITCHIEGVNSEGKGGTDMLPQGIAKGLESSVEKNSPSLGRTALYNKSARISKLPPYLITQFVRFFWKQGVGSDGAGRKAKILRLVKFPMTLDMKEYCTDEYKARITAWRDKVLAKQATEKEAKKAKKPTAAGGAAAGSASAATATAGAAAASGDGAAQAAAAPKESDAAQPAAQSTSMEVEEIPMDDQEVWANYELTGVLTHQGRTAEGGHYVSWIKKDTGQWYKFDDDKVMEVKEEEIKKLYGGGDWHMAYILLYRRCPAVYGSDSTRY